MVGSATRAGRVGVVTITTVTTVLAVVLSGCAGVRGGAEPSTATSQAPSSPEPESSGPASASASASVSDSAAGPVPLEGTTWYQVKRINNDLPIRPAVSPDRWIRFADGTVTFHGFAQALYPGNDVPCPTLVLPAKVTDGVLIYGKGALDSDEARVGCGTRVLNREPGKVTVRLDGRELHITSDQGMNVTEWVFSPDPPALQTVPTSVDLSFLPPPADTTVHERLRNPLTDKTFTATAITGRKLADPGVTLTFGIDQVGLDAGCNSGGAGYTVAGDTVTFTPGASTAMLCSGPVGKQESWLYDFADGAVAFGLDGRTLKLTAGGQTMTLTEKPSKATDPAQVPAPSQPPGQAQGELSVTIDEIVTADGVHPLPTLEQGEFWNQPASLMLLSDAIGFDVGCGLQTTDTTGSGGAPTAGAYNGMWLLQCPPTRTALADALRYILSGELHIDRDGAFLTVTGRNGIVVTAHSGY